MKFTIYNVATPVVCASVVAKYSGAGRMMAYNETLYPVQVTPCMYGRTEELCALIPTGWKAGDPSFNMQVEVLNEFEVEEQADLWNYADAPDVHPFVVGYHHWLQAHGGLPLESGRVAKTTMVEFGPARWRATFLDVDPQRGTIEGTLTAWAGIPAVEIEYDWHLGETTTPLSSIAVWNGSQTSRPIGCKSVSSVSELGTGLHFGGICTRRELVVAVETDTSLAAQWLRQPGYGHTGQVLGLDGFRSGLHPLAAQYAFNQVSAYLAAKDAGLPAPGDSFHWLYDGGAYGAEGSGLGIEAECCAEHFQSGHPRLLEYLVWRSASAWRRQRTHLTKNGVPIGQRVKGYGFNMSPDGRPFTKHSEDPFKTLTAPGNALNAFAYGSRDPQHLPRLSDWDEALACAHNLPGAKRRLRHLAAQCRAALGESHSIGLHEGTAMGRGHGWAARVMAHDFALNGSSDSLVWLVGYLWELQVCQTKSGMMRVDWTSKESTDYARHELALKTGLLDNELDKSVAATKHIWSKLPLKPTRQPYQEVIKLIGALYAGAALGKDILAEEWVQKWVTGILTIGKAPGAQSLDYRQTVDVDATSYAEQFAAGVSGDPSEYYLPPVLALAIVMGICSEQVDDYFGDRKTPKERIAWIRSKASNYDFCEWLLGVLEDQLNG